MVEALRGCSIPGGPTVYIKHVRPVCIKPVLRPVPVHQELIVTFLLCSPDPLHGCAALRSLCVPRGDPHTR